MAAKDMTVLTVTVFTVKVNDLALQAWAQKRSSWANFPHHSR
jgi:hypothetical protein